MFKGECGRAVVRPSPACPALMPAWRQRAAHPGAPGPQVPGRRRVHHWRFSVRGAWPPARLGVLEEGLRQRQRWVDTGIVPQLVCAGAFHSGKPLIENLGTKSFDAVILTPVWVMGYFYLFVFLWRGWINNLFPRKALTNVFPWQVSFWSTGSPWWLCESSLNSSRIHQLHTRTWMRIWQRWGGARTGGTDNSGSDCTSEGLRAIRHDFYSSWQLPETVSWFHSWGIKQ